MKGHRLDASALRPYLAELDATPLLSADEERRLAGRVALGDPADHLVIESWHAGRGVQTRTRT